MFDMQKMLFLLCVCTVTVYLAVTAIEDYKTCKVTRWKHLIGFVPASIWLVVNGKANSKADIAMVLLFVFLFVTIGYAGVYGVADGFVLANLTILFGGIGGVTGVGAVILIMISAGFSFIICHIIRCLIKKKRLFQNKASAFVPHILIGYVIIMLGLWIQSGGK